MKRFDPVSGHWVRDESFARMFVTAFCAASALVLAVWVLALFT